MGTVGRRGERARPAGGVAWRCPANGVARRALESKEVMIRSVANEYNHVAGTR